MKKINLKSFMLLTIAVVLFPSVVLAGEIKGIENRSDLDVCIATTDNTCRLDEDITIDSVIEIAPGKTITLDLNGKSITAADSLNATTGLIIVHNGASLIVNDATNTGKISTGNSSTYAALQVTKKGDTSENTATIIVNGGIMEGFYFGIVGNGTRHNTSITINDGVIKGINADDSVGVYHPQTGILIVNGGTITGATGIEMRAGTLTVNDGTIIGTKHPLEVTENGNGSTTVGAGIAVVQHTTKLDLSVTINGGTIKGFTPFFQVDIEENGDEAIDKISLSVTGGNFIIINEGENSIYSENKTKFVSGGTVSALIDSDYLLDDYGFVKIEEGYSIEQNDVIVDVTEIDTEKEVRKPEIGVKDKELTEQILEDSIPENEDIDECLETSSIVVDVEIEELSEEEIDEEVLSNIKKATGVNTISTYFDISIVIRNATTNVAITNISELTGEIELVVLLPENLRNTDKTKQRAYYMAREHDGETELVKATLSEDGKYLIFKSDKYSTYALAYSDTVVVSNPNTVDSIEKYAILGCISIFVLLGSTITVKKSKEM